MDRAALPKAIILVAAHKEANMPSSPCYFPLHVGRTGKEDIGFIGDDTGENISWKNSRYCELTGLYWAWKNLSCEWLGLVQYRRHFSVKGWWYRRWHKPMECVMTEAELQKILIDNIVIVPKKRKYYIETIYSHYANIAHDGERHLAVTREIIAEKFPAYLSAYDLVMRKTSASMFNMFIMRKELADQYCQWLFDILMEIETRIDVTCDYSFFDKRYVGRVSEMLLNVWLLHNQYQYKEIGYIDLWHVNWPKKVVLFLRAKFFGVKYQQSL